MKICKRGGFHNKTILGSLERNIITGRALAKTKNIRGGSWGGGKGEGTVGQWEGGLLPRPTAACMPSERERERERVLFVCVYIFIYDCRRPHNSRKAEGQHCLIG